MTAAMSQQSLRDSWDLVAMWNLQIAEQDSRLKEARRQQDEQDAKCDFTEAEHIWWRRLRERARHVQDQEAGMNREDQRMLRLGTMLRHPARPREYIYK